MPEMPAKAAEYVEGGADYAAPGGLPSRSDFLRQKWCRREDRWLENGAPVPFRMKSLAARDIGGHAVAKIYGVLPSGRKCHTLAEYNPFFEITGMENEDPLALRKRFEHHARAANQLGALAAAVHVALFTARPLMAGEVQEHPDAVVRYYFRTIKDMSSAMKASMLTVNVADGAAAADPQFPLIGLSPDRDPAEREADPAFPPAALATKGLSPDTEGLPPVAHPHPHMAISMGTKTQQARMLQFVYGLRVNDWVTVHSYARDMAPTCPRCAREHAAWWGCKGCGGAGSAAQAASCPRECGWKRWAWANMDCECGPSEKMVKQAVVRIDQRKRAVLLCTSLLPRGKYPRTGAGAPRNPGRAQIRKFCEEDQPRLTDDERDLTPEFDLVYDIETYLDPKIGSGKPPMGHDERSRLMMVSMVLYERGANVPVAAVLITDTKSKTRTEFLGKMARRGANPRQSPEERALAAETIGRVEDAFPGGWTIFNTPYGDTAAILRAFAVVFGELDPDVLVDFNGHDYDMPFIKEKLELAFDEDSPDVEGFFTRLNAFSVGPRPTGRLWQTFGAKIDGISDVPNRRFEFDACVCVDVMMQMKRVQPLGVPDPDQPGSGVMTFRLDAFLQYYKISPKVAHDFRVMWAAYEANKVWDLTWSGWYCLWDSAGTYRLLNETGIISAREPFATEGFCSNDAAYHNGDGMRVEGAIFAEATMRGYTYTYDTTAVALTPTIRGAWVKPPRPGFPSGCVGALPPGARAVPEEDPDARRCDENDGVPLADFDFRSQYPNTMSCRNLSYETVSTDEHAVKRAAHRLGRQFRVIDAEFKNQARPPAPIWSLYHDDVPGQMGVLPTVVMRWLRRREQIKNTDLKAMKACEGQLNGGRPDTAKVRELLGRIDPRWSLDPGRFGDAELCTEQFARKVARKRKGCGREETAVKKLANTAYGKTVQGQYNRLLCTPVGAAITANARESIHICADMAGEDMTDPQAYLAELRGSMSPALEAFMDRHGARLRLELSRPAPANTHDYTDTDAVCIGLRQAGVTAFVRTMVGMEGAELAAALTALRDFAYAYALRLGDAMNARLKEYYGNSFMEVKLEGLHMRRLFIRSKCYFSLKIGSPAENPTPSWTTDTTELEVFEKIYNCCGVKLKKKNTPPIITRYLIWLVNQTFALLPFGAQPDFDTMVRRIVQDFLGQAPLFPGAPAVGYATFAESAKYNPSAQNAAVLKFVARVKACEMEFVCRGEAPPAWATPPVPGTRFRYVVCGCKNMVTLDGRRKVLSVSDRMVSVEEYEHRAASGRPHVLDYQYYAEKHVAAMLGEILSHLPRYDAAAPPLGDDPSDEQVAGSTKKRSAAAGKDIIGQLQLAMGYTERSLAQAKRDWGPARLALETASPVSRALAEKIGTAARGTCSGGGLLSALRVPEDGRPGDLADRLLADADSAASADVAAMAAHCTLPAFQRILRAHKIDPCAQYRAAGVADVLQRASGAPDRRHLRRDSAALAIVGRIDAATASARDAVIAHAARSGDAYDALALELLAQLGLSDEAAAAATQMDPDAADAALAAMDASVAQYRACVCARQTTRRGMELLHEAQRAKKSGR